MTPVWVAIQHAVIHRLANSQPEPCATQLVRLAAQVIVSWLQQRNYAGSPGTLDVMWPSFAPVLRQRARQIPPNQTVRERLLPLCSRWSSYLSKVKAAGVEGSRAPTVFAPHWIVSFLRVVYIHFCRTDHPLVQCQSAGSTLGLTKACPAKNDKSCQVSCQDPGTANQCIVLQTQLANGSPCGARTFIHCDERIAEVIGDKQVTAEHV